MTSFAHGDVVVVLDNNKYEEVHVGAIGVVKSTYEARITVKFSDIHNPRSSYDCFYFNAKQLEHYKGDNIMNGNYRIARVSFLDGDNTDRTYAYACYDEAINVGDVCVVMSAHHGMGIARVMDIGPKTDEKLTREIICKADFSAYEARKETRKRKAELKRKMADRAAALQELALYKMMAAEDSSMAELMREFDTLEEV